MRSRPPILDQIGGEIEFARRYNDSDSYPSNDDIMASFGDSHGKAISWDSFRRIREYIRADPQTAHLLVDTRDVAWKRETHIITSAINNIPVHEGFWSVLQRIKKDEKGHIWVLPSHYWHRETQIENDGNWWFHEPLNPHRVDLRAGGEDRLAIHPGLNLACTTITATKMHPLEGMAAIAQGACTVFGNGQFALQYLARPTGSLPVWVACPGTVTLPKFIQRTGAGDKARSHHTLGAMVVTTWGPHIWYRYISWKEDSGKCGVIDLGRQYRVAGGKVQVSDAPRAKAIVTHDEHWLWQHPLAINALWGEGGLNETVNPELLVRHDSLDFAYESHHSDYLRRYKLHQMGLSHVETELDFTLERAIETTREGQLSVFVDSNHHRHFDQWLAKGSPETQNMEVYHAVKAKQLQDIREAGGAKSALETFAEIRGYDLSRVRFLARNEPLTIDGIGLECHFDRGHKGQRGSIAVFARSSRKMIGGHGHGPGIRLGAFQVGSGMITEDAGYTGSETDWDVVNAIVYGNGARTLITSRLGLTQAPK